MKFVCVRYWSWRHFFSGEMGIHTELDTTEEQVKEYIERSTQRGGGGNWDTDSLKTGIVKVKANKADIVTLPSINPAVIGDLDNETAAEIFSKFKQT
jgi:hypothetical protein